MIQYKLGYFAESLCGHDKGRIYMIVREEKDMVGLSDGKRRQLDNPKYKKKKHVQMIRSEKTAEAFSALISSADGDAQIRKEISTLEKRIKENRR